jgi:hypothetical protein
MDPCGRQGHGGFQFLYVGAYAEGPYECVFDMDKYKALARPDAPLP